MTRFCSGLVLLMAQAVCLAGLAQAHDEELAQARASGNPFQFVPGWPAPPLDPAFKGAVSALEIDRSGQVWVISRSEVPVRIYNAKGQLIRSWGTGIFQKPHGLGFDAEGRAWITDIGNHTARLFTPEGELVLTLGTPGVAGVDETHFDQPTDAAIGPDGSVYIADGYGNNRVVRFDATGKFLQAFGTEGTGPGQFRLPHALVFDAQGRLYVADRSNGRIQIFDDAGKFLAEWADVMMPWDLWVSPRGQIFACGSSPMRKTTLIKALPPGIPPRDQIVVEFEPTGSVRNRWTLSQGNKPGSVDWVHALTFAPDGTLYLGDIQGQRAQKFVRRGLVDTNVEQAGFEKP